MQVFQNYLVLNKKAETFLQSFITDYASIPKLFRTIILPYGKHSGASVVHDWLYSSNCPLRISRKEADKIFLEILKEEKVNFILRNLMYLAVRKFGGSRFRNGV